VDYTFDFLLVAVLAIVVSAILEAPKFLLAILELRKKWPKEFPPKTLVAMASEVHWDKISISYVNSVVRLMTIRAVFTVFNIALVAVVVFEAWTGNLTPQHWLAAIDAYLIVMLGTGVYVLWRARFLWPFLQLLNGMERDGLLPPTAK
jgi:hypothetical protein